MPAEEMFEELGYELVYKKISSITNITYVKELSKIKRRNRKKAIIFNKYKNEPIDITIDIFLQYKDKKITHWQSGINEQELQAINKQVEELGGEIDDMAW